MDEKDFLIAKKLYNNIVALCLRSSFCFGDKSCFKIYEDISKKCYFLLEQLEHMPLEENDDKYQSDEARRFNEAIYKTYYKGVDGDDFNLRENRAFLKEWNSSENAYNSLKRFSSEYKKDKKFLPNEVVVIFKKVINLLQQNLSPCEIREKVDALLDS